MARLFEDSNSSGLTRRSFITGLGTVAFAGAAAAFLSACGANTSASSSSAASSSSSTASASSASSSSASASAAASTSSSASAAGSAKVGNKVLVAYYSAQGHTEKAAQALASALDADTFEIVPADPYTDDDLDYNDEDSRVVQEYEAKSDKKRDIALEQNAPDNFADYDTVLVGYPIWWSDAAWPIWRFASENDFKGKTVIPFCTSYSSPIGDSGDNLAERAGSGDWQEGHRFDQEFEDSDVTSWADSLKA